MLSAPLRLFALVVLLYGSALAQSPVTALAAGYSPNVPIYAAPGQILNLFVVAAGLDVTAPASAATVPLPTALAGISAQLQLGVEPPYIYLIPVPILAVQPVSTCFSFNVSGCGTYIYVTIQMPYELPGGAEVPSLAFLTISVNGVQSAAFELLPSTAAIHVVTGCDRSLLFGCGGWYVTHANGIPAGAGAPAKSGEELVMYAYGLGMTSPQAATGQAAPSPAATTTYPFQLNFDYRPNAPPSMPVAIPPDCKNTFPCPDLTPLFSGLVPGYVGLYQVNFTVPPVPAGTPACGDNFGPLNTEAYTNLTVSLVGGNSLDGAGICVDPSSAATPAAQAKHRIERTVVPDALRFLKFPRN